MFVAQKPRNERRANALRRVQRLVRSATLHEPIAEHDKFSTIIGAQALHYHEKFAR